MHYPSTLDSASYTQRPGETFQETHARFASRTTFYKSDFRTAFYVFDRILPILNYRVRKALNKFFERPVRWDKSHLMDSCFFQSPETL